MKRVAAVCLALLLVLIPVVSTFDQSVPGDLTVGPMSAAAEVTVSDAEQTAQAETETASTDPPTDTSATEAATEVPAEVGAEEATSSATPPPAVNPSATQAEVPATTGDPTATVEPTTVDVTLSGPARAFYILDRKAVGVTVDAMLADLGRRTFQIDTDNVRRPAGTSVENLQPARVRISLRKRSQEQNGGTTS